MERLAREAEKGQGEEEHDITSGRDGLGLRSESGNTHPFEGRAYSSHPSPSNLPVTFFPAADDWCRMIPPSHVECPIHCGRYGGLFRVDEYKGKGNSGIVYRGTRVGSGEPSVVAIKFFYTNKSTPADELLKYEVTGFEVIKAKGPIDVSQEPPDQSCRPAPDRFHACFCSRKPRDWCSYCGGGMARTEEAMSATIM